MTNSYKLDDLRAEMDKKYAPLTIEVGRDKFVLRNLLRIGESDRTEIQDALKTMNSEDDDKIQVAVLSAGVDTILRIVPADNKGPKLLEALQGDITVGMKVIELWIEATDLGEASSSPS